MFFPVLSTFVYFSSYEAKIKDNSGNEQSFLHYSCIEWVRSPTSSPLWKYMKPEVNQGTKMFDMLHFKSFNLDLPEGHFDIKVKAVVHAGLNNYGIKKESNEVTI